MRPFQKMTGTMLSALAAGLVAGGATPAAAPPPTKSVQRVAGATTAFGLDLLAHLNARHGGKNVFLSPFSVSQALTLALNGAGGETEHQIARTLHLPGVPLATINAANGELLPTLTHPEDGITLDVGNALWANRGTRLDPGFRARCRRDYGATTEVLDFASPSAAARINGWVSDKTHGKIPHLVSAGDLHDSPAVLTNAVYFHGKWTSVFEKSMTQDAPFKLTASATKTVPMMSQTNSVKYLETSDFQAARLPYGRGRLAMYVFLPKATTGLDALVKGMTADRWQTSIEGMKPAQVQLFLPRFKASQSVELSQPLSEMGMKEVFEPGADFRPMGLERGFIGAVLHKAIVEVDEEGTTAAAATGIVMRAAITSVARPPILMRVDHPFLCAIRDDATGTLLFVGAIRDPE